MNVEIEDRTHAAIQGFNQGKAAPELNQTKTPPDGLELICANSITPEPIKWLWDGYLAAGKVHVLGGAPGAGKTTIALALAATATIGGRWPDGTKAQPGNVAIWSGEDDRKDTLVPRLTLMGADLSRVYFVGDIVENLERRAFDPAQDILELTRRLADVGNIKLLIIDPIVSAITGDSHKNAEVRRGLQPLADLSASLKCALLGITHFTKGTAGRDPVERITGSLAFGAVARIVMVAAKQLDEDGNTNPMRLLCRAKSNIGSDDGGFEYELHQSELASNPGVIASGVRWGEAVEGAARELLAVAESNEKTTDDEIKAGSALDKAMKFLIDLLADGAMSTNDIKKDAAEAGFSWATIRRAKDELNISPIKTGFGGDGKWGWILEDAQTCSTSTEQKNSEHLSTLAKGVDFTGYTDQEIQGFEPKMLRRSSKNCLVGDEQLSNEVEV